LKGSIRNSSFPATARQSTQAREAIAFTRDYISIRSERDGDGGKGLTISTRLRKTDWSKIPGHAAFAANTAATPTRIYLELEQSQFKADKP